MTERSLGDELLRRFTRLTWLTLTGFVGVVTLAFLVFAEINLRRTLGHSVDVVESLLGLYADPAGSPTTVAPEMLADRLVGMGGAFVITRIIKDEGTMTRRVYFLKPDMPAQELAGIGENPTAESIRKRLRETVAARGRWRYRVLHRSAGDFDIFVAADRGGYLPFVSALLGLGLMLLPLAGIAARRGARHAVGHTLQPLHQVTQQTKAIGPRELDRRLSTPTGQAEITDLANEVNRMLDRVERAQRSLEAFTANVSHELRTPLTHLRAQAQWALAERRVPEEIREALLAIEGEVQRTTKLAEDMLLIARMENRQLAVRQERFDLAPLVAEVQEITCALVEGRDITVLADCPADTWVLGDPDRTRQILLNLSTNAVRHTASGQIAFRIQTRNSSIGTSVSDTGEGIPVDALQHIFDRFYRAERSRSREHGGTGLCLTIARLLAELQGGSLSVDSTPGKGSTFTLCLPSGTARI